MLTGVTRQSSDYGRKWIRGRPIGGGLAGRGLKVVGNNKLEAALNTLARGEHSPVSAENSDGIDPDYCCRVAVVRWRRILG
jgi:hypothetical protein